MYGWISIFVLMLLFAPALSASVGMEPAFVLITRIVFGILLLLSALTFVLRRRA